MKAKVTVVFHLEYEVLDRDEDAVQFFIEENHCHDNFVTHLHKMIEADPGHCQTCMSSEAFVGHIPFKAIGELRSEQAKE